MVSTMRNKAEDVKKLKELLKLSNDINQQVSKRKCEFLTNSSKEKKKKKNWNPMFHTHNLQPQNFYSNFLNKLKCSNLSPV